MSLAHASSHVSSDIALKTSGLPAGVVGASDFGRADVRRVQNFWRTVEHIPAGAGIRVDPESRKRQIVVVSGWISETRILRDGRRQIFAFLLPGDVASVSSASHVGSRGLVALTNVEIADAAALATDGGAEMASTSVADAIRQREERLLDHIVRLGRLTARERVVNLLLELHDRLQVIGLVKENGFRLPLTQEVFADALGLSVVHINRTLQQLRREGVVTVGRGRVTLHQRDKLAAFACYQSASERFGLERQACWAGAKSA